MSAKQQSSQTRRVWLVTGCSSGLGQSLVSAILASGDKVVVTARNTSALSGFEGVDHAKILQLDVTASESVIREKTQQAIEAFGQVDVLVNNAGFVSSGVWEEVDHEETSRQFETNFFGALKMSRAVLPHMRSRKSGTIFFMSSIAGWYGAGAGGPYSSSKFALEGAAECLDKEVSPLGLKVHLLVLGQFRTNILDPNRKADSLGASDLTDYDPIKNEMSQRHVETNGRQPGDPEQAVQKMVKITREEPPVGDAWPLRIPLGSDAIQVMRAKCEQTLQQLKGWEEYAKSMDFADAGAVPTYLR